MHNIKTKEEIHAEILKEHFPYEIDMFRWSANVLMGKIELITNYYNFTFLKNSLIEIFALHTRTLIYFFFEGGKKDDSIAQEFIPNWNHLIHGLYTTILQEAKDKANKQLAHLTKSRVTKYINKEKPWQIEAIFNDLENAIKNIL